ncbi:hypothetical protein B0H19DRAFT_1070248 [Mycena capillaripes]|nr:hypothetical protein B0H19DRAFT_1070248 [Mycena capillaripes]
MLSTRGLWILAAYLTSYALLKSKSSIVNPTSTSLPPSPIALHVNIENFKLNLGQFPSPAQLHIIAVYGEDLQRLVSRVLSLNGHTGIRLIKVANLNRLAQELHNRNTEAKLRDIDTVLAGSLPVLENVDIRWNTGGYSESSMSVRETMTLFQTAFPALHARRLLWVGVEPIAFRMLQNQIWEETLS